MASAGMGSSEAGQAGGAASTGSAADTGMPESGGQRAGGAEVGNQGDLEGIFDKSLGEFDKEMQRENTGIASTGQGSGQAAAQRESRDAGAVRDGMGSSSGGGFEGAGAGAGGMASIPSSSGTSGSAGGPTPAQAEPGAQSSEEAGPWQDRVKSGLGGGDGEESERDDGQVARIPEDIPADGSAEDQVARQIREAAMAETDPDIREALWDEYRKHTGIK